MAAGTADSKKDTTSNAQNRFVVSLPAEVGTMIDAVGARISASLESATGVAFELSRAQIVQSLVRQAHDQQNGDGGGDGGGGGGDTAKG